MAAQFSEIVAGGEQCPFAATSAPTATEAARHEQLQRGRAGQPPLGDVQQGIGDLKARVASSDSLIKEMEAKLAQARRQKEEAGAAP